MNTITFRWVFWARKWHSWFKLWGHSSSAALLRQMDSKYSCPSWKEIPKILIPVLIKVRNQYPEGPKHFLPRITTYILLHVSGLPGQFGNGNELSYSRTKLHIFLYACNRDQGALQYLGHWKVDAGRCLTCFEGYRKMTWQWASVWNLESKQCSHFSICSMVVLPQHLGQRTRCTWLSRPTLKIFSISRVLSTRKRPSFLCSWAKKGEHGAAGFPLL